MSRLSDDSAANHLSLIKKQHIISPTNDSNRESRKPPRLRNHQKMTAPTRSSSPPPTSHPSLSVSYIRPSSCTDPTDEYFQNIHYIAIELIASITHLPIEYSFTTNIGPLSYTVTQNKHGVVINWTSKLRVSPSNETQPTQKDLMETPSSSKTINETTNASYISKSTIENSPVSPLINL